MKMDPDIKCEIEFRKFCDPGPCVPICQWGLSMSKVNHVLTSNCLYKSCECQKFL